MNDYKDYGINGLTTGFELIVGPPDGIIDNADVPVRWCVTPELIAELERLRIKTPHVILGTMTPRGKHEWRTIVPLGDMLAYARFYKAGTMRLFAIIVDVNAPYMKEREYGEFTLVLQRSGKLLKAAGYNDGLTAVYASAEADVTIPEGVFGKEPTGWIKWFANLWHGKHKAEDQCEFRRRLIIAFGIKWIFVIGWVIVYTISSLAVLLGLITFGLQAWITNWRTAFRPFGGSWDQMFDAQEGEYGDLRDSRYVVWITWNKDPEVKQPLWTLCALSPFAAGAIASAMFFAVYGSSDFWWYEWHRMTTFFVLFVATPFIAIDIASGVLYGSMKVLGYYKPEVYEPLPNMFTVGAVLAFVIFAITTFTFLASPWLVTLVWALGIGGIGLLAVNNAPKPTSNFSNIFDRIHTIIFGKDVNDYTEIRELLCPKDHANLTTDIDMIPKERRTWRLRVSSFKHKVCRPMQR